MVQESWRIVADALRRRIRLPSGSAGWHSFGMRLGFPLLITAVVLGSCRCDEPLRPSDDDDTVDGGVAADADSDGTIDAVAGDDAGVIGLPEGACDAPAASGTCNVLDAEGTCPGGRCVLGMCVGPVVDDARYDACGDGVCLGCDADASRETWCMADCIVPPVVEDRRYDDPAVLTVFIHGYQNKKTSDLAQATYGGAIPAEVAPHLLDIDRALFDGMTFPSAPHQLVGVEYYGAHADPSLNADDVAFVEEIPWNTPEALERYARIVAVFIEQRMRTTGARTVNLVCHSMGCHISRFLVEHDVRALSSSGKLARLVTIAGALQGARLARMLDNPITGNDALQGLINVWDAVHLDPAYARGHTAIWDHKLREANNPMWRGVLVHSVLGSDNLLDETLNIFSAAEINNPDHLPNDGLVFSFDAMFWDEVEDNRIPLQSGSLWLPSHSILHRGHSGVRDDRGTARVIDAALFSRKVMAVNVSHLELDEAHDDDDELPADVAVQSIVSWASPDGFDVVDERFVAHRTVDVVPMTVGAALDVAIPIYEGPVPEDLASVHLVLDVVEVDRYDRFDIDENGSEPAVLAHFEGDVAVAGGVHEITGTGADGAFSVAIDRF